MHAIMEYQDGENPALIYLASLSPGSRRTMRQALDQIAKLFWPDSDCSSFPWHLLRSQHTIAIRSELQARYAPATANKMLSALRGTLKRAYRMGQMGSEEYTAAVDLDPIPGGRIGGGIGRSLTRREMHALREACADGTVAGRRDWALLCVGFGCGLRRAEIAALKADDYDGNTLTITGKRSKTRDVPVADFVKDALSGWLSERNPQSRMLFSRIGRNGRVYADPLSPQAIYYIQKRRQRMAGLASFSPHDMRRTFAGNLLDAGVDIATVQSLMGHASIETTARYDRRGERAKRDAIAKLSI